MFFVYVIFGNLIFMQESKTHQILLVISLLISFFKKCVYFIYKIFCIEKTKKRKLLKNFRRICVCYEIYSVTLANARLQQSNLTIYAYRQWFYSAKLVRLPWRDQCKIGLRKSGRTLKIRLGTCLEVYGIFFSSLYVPSLGEIINLT